MYISHYCISEATFDGKTSHAVVITGAYEDSGSCLGRIINGNKTQMRRAASNVWVELETNPHIALRSVIILDKIIPLSDINLVIFNTTEICESELISNKFPCGEKSDHANDIVPYLIHCVQRDCSEKFSTRNVKICDRLLLYTFKIILLISWIPKLCLQYVNTILTSRLDYTSTALKQILLRIKQIEKIKEELEGNCKTLISGRLLAMIMMDVVAGITIACVISSYASVDDVYSYFRSCTKVSIDFFLLSHPYENMHTVYVFAVLVYLQSNSYFHSFMKADAFICIAGILLRLCKFTKVNINLLIHLPEHESKHRSICSTHVFKPGVHLYLYCSCVIVSITLFVLV